MSNKPEDRLARFTKDFKLNSKRSLIILVCLFPILFGFGMLFYFAGLADWLSVMLIVCIGAVLFIGIELLYFVHSSNKKEKQKLEPKKFDPFAD